MAPPKPRILLVASQQTAGGRAGYVFSVAPGWRVTVATGAAAPSDDDAQVVLDVCFPRWNVRWPGQPGL